MSLQLACIWCLKNLETSKPQRSEPFFTSPSLRRLLDWYPGVGVESDPLSVQPVFHTGLRQLKSCRRSDVTKLCTHSSEINKWDWDCNCKVFLLSPWIAAPHVIQPVLNFMASFRPSSCNRCLFLLRVAGAAGAYNSGHQWKYTLKRSSVHEPITLTPRGNFRVSKWHMGRNQGTQRKHTDRWRTWSPPRNIAIMGSCLIFSLFLCSSSPSVSVWLQQGFLWEDDPWSLPGQFQDWHGRTGPGPEVQLAGHNGVSSASHVESAGQATKIWKKSSLPNKEAIASRAIQGLRAFRFQKVPQTTVWTCGPQRGGLGLKETKPQFGQLEY